MKSLLKYSKFRQLACLLTFSLLVPISAQAEELKLAFGTGVKAKIAIYCHQEGKSRGAVNLMTFLTPENGFNAVIVSPEEIQAGALKNQSFDVLIMPGGMASAQANNLGETGRENVREFVNTGGGYVGICAGAYLSTTYRLWSLGIVNARVWDLSHWARGTGMVNLCMSDSGCKVLAVPSKSVETYYGQGPLLVPGNSPDLPGYEVLASYETEIAKKGAPEGAMTDAHAIIRTMYGSGRVICYSPHPEKEWGPKELMAHGVRWASGVDEK
ncbi:BPL-N domain-containing protein [uncultured Rubinisphaera sp.]|uniref:BPL-N domain-containing protein n=1 Tax=uncultured Rubinisphaera sp. TaxID=1678686 RepID=UPI0030D86C55